MATRTATNGPASDRPRCSDMSFGYGIGNCAGCGRFPVVLYVRLGRWRCEGCYLKENGAAPSNKVHQ